MENISLKIKKSLVLETVQIIIILYAVFLFFLGIIIKNTEVVIEVIIMLSIAIIFNYLNKEKLVVKKDELLISEKKSIKYVNIENITIKNYVLQIKIKEVEKPLKIFFSRNTSKNDISKFYKYVTSKI